MHLRRTKRKLLFFSAQDVQLLFCAQTGNNETGLINVTVWRAIAERYRAALAQSVLLTVYGTVDRDREGTTVYVIAGRLVDDSILLGGLATRSRDFH